MSTRQDPLKITGVGVYIRDQYVHIQEAKGASVNHGPRTWAGLGLWMRNPCAQQLGMAANGGRADIVMKKTYGPFKRQLVSEEIALEVEYF